MSKNEKIQAFVELFDLINYYYENRDRPKNGLDFFNEVEHYCSILDLDFIEFKREFKLLELGE